MPAHVPATGLAAPHTGIREIGATKREPHTYTGTLFRHEQSNSSLTASDNRRAADSE